MPLNSPIISGDVSGGLHSTSVDKLKGNAVASTTPTNGQVLTWNGTQWAPAASTGGGGGGANGLTYYLNQGTDADAPTTNLPGTPKQLGRSADASQTTAASGTLTPTTWTQFAGFVTESTPQDPGSTDIPAGLWDVNCWLLGVAGTNQANQVRVKVFKYNGTDAPTLLATSAEVTIGTTAALVGFTVLVPETTMLVTDRIFVTLEAYATGNNHSVTGQFGGNTPSHVHTSLALTGGTGLWKNVAGVLQPNASLLVNADVDANAAIASSKLATVQVAQGGTGVTASSGANSVVLRDANANISANAVQEAFQTIVKSASTLTLTAASARQYRLSGSVAGQNINIPPVNTLQNGDVFYFINTGSTSVALNNSNGDSFHTLQGLASARVVIVDNADNAAGFQIVYQIPSNVPWSSSTLSFTGSISGATWAGNTVAVNRGGTGQTTFTNGQLLIGNTTGNTLTKSTLTAGSNVTITNGPGTITIASTGGSATPTDVQVFTSSGTWTKPAGARVVEMHVIGGGGGGGSGCSSPSGTAAGGGAGGGGGGRTFVSIDASFLGETETVTVGAAGNGGAFVLANAGNGANGTAAGASAVGPWAYAGGGSFGGGGTSALTPVPVTGGGSTRAVFVGGAGGAVASSAGSQTFGNGGGGGNVTAGCGGGAGGGVNAGGTVANGGVGGFQFIYNGALAGGTPVGQNGFSVPTNLPYGGSGGGGGNASKTTTAMSGGNGGLYGAGGGGGGAGQGFASGAGGNGAQGIVVVITYF